MPAKKLPDKESFEAFRRALAKRGFRKRARAESRGDYVRLALRAPSPRKGRERGYVFSANGLDVVVWTTFLEEEECAREEDSGWVLIKEGDKVRYFSRPHPRTENFLKTLLWEACIARLRVLARPLCPMCRAHMSIVYGKGHKSRFWQCKRPKSHEKSQNISWDHGLPPEALEYLRPIRERRRKYLEKLRSEGKSPGAALKKRKKWRVGNPQNLK
jgi:hypothetical protein